MSSTNSRFQPASRPIRCSVRRGVALPEVVLVVVIISLAFLLLLFRMPRGREQSRAMTCLSNLGQIGQAISYYSQATGQYPTSPGWGPGAAGAGTSVLWNLRDTLQVKDFSSIASQLKAKKAGDGKGLPSVVVGLRCPSDRVMEPLTATNYRANAGDDSTGRSGPFGIGQVVSPKQVEAGYGQAFTAAFGERLIGNGKPESSMANYQLTEDCSSAIAASVATDNESLWKGNAGHEWSRGDGSQSLYQHGITPNWRRSAVAMEGNCGQMGLSSDHPGVVNLLMLDGSAKAWRDSVNPKIWSKLGRFDDGQTGSN